MSKVYLGDAVYADHDGYHVVLTTEDGIRVSNTICLEPLVLEALAEYVAGLKQKQEGEMKCPDCDTRMVPLAVNGDLECASCSYSWTSI